MSHPLATPHGLTLAGVVLAKWNKDGSFAITGREKFIHAQLQAAYGKQISSQTIGYVRRCCEILAKVSDEELYNATHPFFPNPHAKVTIGNDFSDLTKGLMMFALTGLNDMDDPIAGKERLLKMQRSPRPDALLKSYGLPTWEELTKDDDSDDDEEDESDSDDSDSGDDNGDYSGSKSHYNPDEPRIPAGQPGGGQWTTGDGNSGGGAGSNSANVQSNNSMGYHGAPDLPIEPVYPIEEALAFIFGGEVITLAREALGFTEGAAAVGAAGEDTVIEGATDHGALRAAQRAISDDEVQEAIQSAKNTGNVVTQIGKYGTPQNVYTGTNGVTVVVETSGRNANKIITAYRK